MSARVHRGVGARGLDGRGSGRGSSLGLLAGVVLVVSLCLFVGVGSALAAGGHVASWAVNTVATPTNFSSAETSFCDKSDGCDAYGVTVTNVGTVAAGVPVVVRDRLPAGVIGVGTEEEKEFEPNARRLSPSCEVRERVVTCVFEGEGTIPPNAVLSFLVNVITLPGAPSVLTNRVEVEGGGAPSASIDVSNTANGAASLFGLQDFSVGMFGLEGAPDVQAGGHPGTNSVALDWTTVFNKEAGESKNVFAFAVQEPRTQIVDLPPGLVADAQAVESCLLYAVRETKKLNTRSKCPAGSQVGFVTIENFGAAAELVPLYNVPPEAGYPAEFAFEYVGAVVTLLPRVLPSASGYVVSVSAPAIPRVQTLKVTGARVTLFGVPREHDGSGSGEAFLRNPSDCGAGPLDARVEMDSWLHPGEWVSAQAPMFEASGSQGVSGCGALHFDPSIAVAPETTQADTPSGYGVDVKLPQAPNIPSDLGSPDLKNAVVTLPEGVSVSPSAANGLVACQESGGEGIELGDRDRFASEDVVEEGEELGPDGLVHPAAGHCPAASQVGEVEAFSPILAEPLRGHAFVAAPLCGGVGQPLCTPESAEDGQLFGIYIEVAGSGVVVKMRGDVSVNPSTGRLTTSFTEVPQQPVSEVRLRLNGGARAPLANPQACGTATTTSDLTPWSAPETPDVSPSSSFLVTGCTGGFAPSFTAGMTSSSTAGAYSPFMLTFSRRDGEQDLSGLTVEMPAGLAGKIAGVAECGEAEVRAAEANTGGCPAGSVVGTATAAAGAGSAPFWQSGPVYLTGPYNGGSFGLAVVVAANAGPFHLGNIVVRAAIHINPVTAAVTVVSDPLPQMIDGVPLRVQTVNVTVGGGTPFTFNPTSCEASSVGASIKSVQGTSVGVSSPYQATGCKSLPFKPSFTVSTQGTASKADGASLDVKVQTHQGPDEKAGEEEANIRKVDTQLPLELPSRLSTLQKACTEQQFAANPAGCPAGAFVGTAIAHTPLLPVPLEGPAILVSHAGASFPDLDLILQGDGVVVDLTGNTDIKKGITYSRFETTPDAPISSFELKLPEGPGSILGSFIPTGGYSFCNLKKIVTTTKTVTRRVNGKTKHVKVKVKTTRPAALEMPTTLVAQNGAVVTQDTKIAVVGCPTAKTAKAAVSKAHKSSARKPRTAGRTGRTG